VTTQYDDDLKLAFELADAADAITMARYRAEDLAVETKPDLTPVSESDKACELALRELIGAARPQDSIIGEEFGGVELASDPGRAWVIDPIDGTNNFIAGLGIFAVCIGLLEAGKPVLGVVYDVTRDHLYAAAAGQGAWLGTQRLSVLKTPLGDKTMLMLTSNLVGADGKAPPYARRWLDQTNWKIRMLGAACVEAMHVAAGVAHGAVTLNGKLWDIAASAAVAIEAGAIVTDPRGNAIFPFDLEGYRGGKVPYVMAGPAAHAELVREMRR